MLISNLLITVTIQLQSLIALEFNEFFIINFYEVNIILFQKYLNEL